jgi:hypothetical protein
MKEEDPVIIRMNIAHYGALLRLICSVERRSVLTRLLTEAEVDLAWATGAKKNDDRGNQLA